MLSGCGMRVMGGVEFGSATAEWEHARSRILTLRPRLTALRRRCCGWCRCRCRRRCSSASSTMALRVAAAVCAISARAADSAYGPPEPIAIRPSSGSITSPVPEMISEVSLSATASSASSLPRRRSVRHSLASSTAARVSWPCFSSLASNSSNSVNASAAAPAKPASTWPSRPSRRTLRALAFITVLPSVTWPSPATATRPSRRTDTMVVAWKTLGLWLGSMRTSGVSRTEVGSTRDGARSKWPFRPSGERRNVGAADGLSRGASKPGYRRPKRDGSYGLRFARGCAASYTLARCW